MEDTRGAYRDVTLTVAPDAEKNRIDKYLSELKQLDLSRSRIQTLIADGLILVDGHAVKANYKVIPGQIINVKIPPPPRAELSPENIPLNIVFEDDHLIVVNKPAGMVTHPGPGNRTGTLVNAVIHYTSALSGVDPERPGIVHRLDKNTSGLVIIAKNDLTHRKLQKSIKERLVKKTYLAVVCGHMKEEHGVIDLPIGRSLKDRKKMTVTNLKSREAVTEYELIERFKLYDYLKINLKTGRTHQIRVHFSHGGHPVLGDPDYGGREKWHRGVISYDKAMARNVLALMPRQALHAKGLAFDHPVTGQPLDIESDLPDDFAGLIDFLKREGR
jgi:23S rRNA pseudouridine1911/1915/1917 synthase